MSFVRKSFAPRAGVGTEITPDKVLDNYYGFNRLLELKQGAMGDSQWDAGDSDVRSGKKYGKTGGVTGIGTYALSVVDQYKNVATVYITDGADVNAIDSGDQAFPTGKTGYAIVEGAIGVRGARTSTAGYMYLRIFVNEVEQATVQWDQTAEVSKSTQYKTVLSASGGNTFRVRVRAETYGSGDWIRGGAYGSITFVY